MDLPVLHFTPCLLLCSQDPSFACQCRKNYFSLFIPESNLAFLSVLTFIPFYHKKYCYILWSFCRNTCRDNRPPQGNRGLRRWLGHLDLWSEHSWPSSTLVQGQGGDLPHRGLSAEGGGDCAHADHPQDHSGRRGWILDLDRWQEVFCSPAGWRWVEMPPAFVSVLCRLYHCDFCVRKSYNFFMCMILSSFHCVYLLCLSSFFSSFLLIGVGEGEVTEDFWNLHISFFRGEGGTELYVSVETHFFSKWHK